MKIPFLSIAIAFSVLAACNNNKKTGNQPAVIVAGETKPEATELEKKMEVLQQLTPYSIEEMQAMVPAVVNEDSTTDISARTNMGTGFASATYKVSDSSAIELSIFDCGGSAGAGIYNAQFATLLDNNTDPATKVISFKSGKALQHEEGSDISLTYLAKDRLLVILDGKNLSSSELKQFAGHLRF